MILCRIKEAIVRFLNWLAKSPESESISLSTPEETEAEMEAARRRILEAQRRIRLIQMSVDVITRGKH